MVRASRSKRILTVRTVIEPKWLIKADNLREVDDNKGRKRYWKYEKEDYDEDGWDNVLDIPLVASIEIKSLIEGRILHIRNAYHYALKRLDATRNRTILMYISDISQDNEVKDDLINKNNNNQTDPLLTKNNGNISNLNEDNFGMCYPYINRIDLFSCKNCSETYKYEEGRICRVLYPSEHTSKWESEYYRIMYYDTLCKVLRYALDMIKMEDNTNTGFSDIILSQYCPTIYWNIVRIFKGDLDAGIKNLLPLDFPKRNFRRRRRSIQSIDNKQSAIKSHPEIYKIRSKLAEERKEKVLEYGKFNYLKKQLERELFNRISYFREHNIPYITNVPVNVEFDEKSTIVNVNGNSVSSQISNINDENCLSNIEDNTRYFRRSRRSYRLSGPCDEQSLINIYIDFKLRLVRHSLENLCDKWKKVIYKTCLESDIRSSMLIAMDSTKGRCVIAGANIRKDDFILEYKGQLISDLHQAEKLEKLYAEENKGCFMYYFKYNDKNYCIDATDETKDYGPGRLINHSRKRPNLVSKVLNVGLKPRLFFIAKRDIYCGEELLFDYGEYNPEVILSNPWLMS
ncbi:SET domain-containing protein [Cryptosporidium andersoni]|uniref:SET domain-containing protein n=1 Tax=Cryptosporidium andersoni TaxID=117008 RepID=A0A1J4MPU6_9CRYT|nr:SET domain-containing protein [Cryptosporidium andersoni]